MLRRLRLQVGDVDVAAFIAIDDNHLQPAHLRRGGIGAVRGSRDQADVAVAFTLRGLIAADRDQAGVFALRA